MRRTVGNDVTRLHRGAICQHDALYAVLACKDPDCLSVHMDLAAQFKETLDEGEGNFMRAGLGADCAAQDIAVDHGSIVRKTHVLQVRAEVTPISA